jgi:outer membrane protein assembly factor BamB
LSFNTLGKMMSPTKNTQPRIFTFEELTVWRNELPDVEFAALPAGNTRPNPLIADDKLFVSIFSPGAVCALDRDTGRLIWRRELGKFSGAPVYFYDRKLFAHSPHTLYSLSPGSGEILWSFCPYGTDGEWIYSSPANDHGNLYIGDRKGFLHCLDSNTGETIWSKRTNSDENDDVSSTPIIVDGLVIVPTNAKVVIAYEAATGKDGWKQKVDGPCRLGPLQHSGLLVVVAVESVYLLDPANGKLRQHFQWKGDSIAFAESTERDVVIALRGEFPPNGNSELAFLNESGTHRTGRLTGHCLHFRYSADNGLLYASHLHGVDLCNPDTGDVLCKLTTTGRGGDTALVDVKEETIYVLTGDGSVHALRHPNLGADSH